MGKRQTESERSMRGQIERSEKHSGKEYVFYCNGCENPPKINGKTQELAIRRCDGCVNHTTNLINRWFVLSSRE